MKHTRKHTRAALMLTALILSVAFALSGCAYMTIEQRDTTVIGRDQGAP